MNFIINANNNKLDQRTNAYSYITCRYKLHKIIKDVGHKGMFLHMF